MTQPTDHTTMRRLDRIHRCECGAWIYRHPGQPTTCPHIPTRKESAA